MLTTCRVVARTKHLAQYLAHGRCHLRVRERPWREVPFEYSLPSRQRVGPKGYKQEIHMTLASESPQFRKDLRCSKRKLTVGARVQNLLLLCVTRSFLSSSLFLYL